MKVVRNRGVGTLVLNNRTAMFVFSNPGSAFVAVQKAIQKAMTYIGHSWLRDLLLAHNNNSITPTAPPPVTDAWLDKFPPLNKEQALALARAIIEGPPGTGKTGVVSKIVIHNIDVHRKSPLVAEKCMETALIGSFWLENLGLRMRITMFQQATSQRRKPHPLHSRPHEAIRDPGNANGHGGSVKGSRIQLRHPGLGDPGRKEFSFVLLCGCPQDLCGRLKGTNRVGNSR